MKFYTHVAKLRFGKALLSDNHAVLTKPGNTVRYVRVNLVCKICEIPRPNVCG